MFRKSKKILDSEILLKIDPPKKEINKYLRIFLVVIFMVFSGFMFYTTLNIFSRPAVYLISGFAYIVLCLVIVFVFMRLKGNSLVFTERGITDGMLISVFWKELEFYKFGSLPDIGPNKFRRVLRIVSNKPPFYQLRYIGLPRYLYDRGLFFSDDEFSKAEEIFRSKGIPKEPK
jgi:hypothetical protein